MNAQELRDKYLSLYEYMSNSNKTENMMLFGKVMSQMMDEMIQTSQSKAEEYICKLESMKWNNYLTPTEADKIVAAMSPKAPWTKDQWKAAMESHGYELEQWPCYNKCALWVVMNMVMSDSSKTIEKYLGDKDIFEVVHELALDKLKDEDGKFNVREYFSV